TYLGGAELAFAGKGAFFREHGYTQVRGWKHWADLGYERFNDWGLSDSDLFEQAFAGGQGTVGVVHVHQRTAL
ncbi:unnamed protein product, partial [marine sediment metagenome]